MKTILRYFGGKGKATRQICDRFPDHICYVESFGGSAAILLNKVPSPVEIYNDLDGEVVNLFRVLRSGQAEYLIEAVSLTPYSREELNHSEPDTDPVERARRLLVRSWFGIANDAGRAPKTGFRVSRNRIPSAATDWKNLQATLKEAVERLRNVVIERRDALELIVKHDGPGTLHFVDPPYLKSTRSGNGCYTHELTDTEHTELLRILKSCVGKVVLCGYDNELYNAALNGWSKASYGSICLGGSMRSECLWMNFPDQLSLF